MTLTSPSSDDCDILTARCPSRDVLRAMTSHWGAMVLIALRGGTLRFNELRRRIGGVSARMLSETLKRLEAQGLVRRVAYPVAPPTTEYSLTDAGFEGAGHVVRLTDWIEDNTHRLPGPVPSAD